MQIYKLDNITFKFIDAGGDIWDFCVLSMNESFRKGNGVDNTYMSKNGISIRSAMTTQVMSKEVVYLWGVDKSEDGRVDHCRLTPAERDRVVEALIEWDEKYPFAGSAYADKDSRFLL